MRAISAVVGLVVLLAAGTSAQDGGSPRPSLLKATVAKLPIHFVENRGVYADEVAYYVQGADKTLFFTKDGITFRLEGEDKGWVVKLEFVGANPDVKPRGEDQRQAVFSYFKGPEKDWKTGLRTFAKVVYEDLWPGIDLVYRGTVNKLKYEFVVKPGAHPEAIRLRYHGATGVEVTEAGGLRIATPVGRFEDGRPVAYQEHDGERAPVRMSFALSTADRPDGSVFGFEIGEYDPTKPLVLDPVLLVYCGYIGGSSADEASGIAVDSNGSAYVIGRTLSDQRTFPAKVGPVLLLRGSCDVFVAKVKADGTALLYCGYLGGSNYDFAECVAVDVPGNAYVAGWTLSADFPVRVGPDLTYNGGPMGDGFVAKINAAGTSIDYCGFVGGAQDDMCCGIVVDPLGNAHVTGATKSNQSTFPVRVGPDLTHNGGWDAFVAEVDRSGRSLVYCGYIGGSSSDMGFRIAQDGPGNLYLTGDTSSTEATFPVKVGPDLTSNGGNDAFVAKIGAGSTVLQYCGYVGGVFNDSGSDIAVDRSGRAHITGWTDSPETSFPVKVGPGLIYNNRSANMRGDAFIAKVSASGAALDYCGYIGGSSTDAGRGIGLDDTGCAYVAGWATSADFPFKIGPRQWSARPNYGEVFVAKVSNTGAGFVYCGMFGGTDMDDCRGIAVDTRGNVWVTGTTQSNESSFPVTVGPDLTFNSSQRSDGDVFVARISHTLIHGSGTARPGGRVSLHLHTSHAPAHPYQVGTSLGTGPIPIDSRKVDLSPDGLLAVTVMGYWPAVFAGYRGVIDSKGQAQATIHIPNIPALIGVRLHSAFVTLDPAAPSGIRSISNTFSFSITK